MFPRKTIKKPPELRYPHKFKEGDLIVPKKNASMGKVDGNSLAVIVSFEENKGVQSVQIMFQNTGRVATYNIATLVMLFEKLT